ncbi:MAG: hypothetical protein M3300_11805 [Actinomycetota bacterium]|nr:hypothetical protein [Actinomycetota bacterium]
MTASDMADRDQSVGPPALAAHHRGSAVHLPLHIEQLLVDVVADGFTLYCCGPKAGPSALVATYRWIDYVDLVTIRGFDWITTARACASPGGKVDVLAPDTVVWSYEGPPQWALRGLLELVHPQHPRAPAHPYPAPPSLYIPRTEQRPMTIRFPAPNRVGMRAARLATARTPD